MPTPTRLRLRHSRPRRAVAMLLVLISLMMATIITAAYLASRDNSSLIGANVARAAEARWAAMAGLELGVAVLQTESDWRTDHEQGRLLADHALHEAAVDVDLVDLETGKPPTEETRHVRMTVTARAGGVAHVAVATAEVFPELVDGNGKITVDLRDFATYALEKVKLDHEATIMRWPTAPASSMGDKVALGISATEAGAVHIKSDSAAIDAVLYTNPGASSLIISNESGPAVELVELPDPVPVPAAPPDPSDPGAASDAQLEIMGSETLDADGHYESVQVEGAAALLTLDGELTLVVDDGLEIRDGGGLIVDGDVTLVVRGDLRLDDGAFLELAPEAALTLYVDGVLGMTGSFIGELRDDRSVRDVSGQAPWIDPLRIAIYGTGKNENWTLDDNSLVKASIYMPDDRLDIRTSSALYGRVTCARLGIDGSSGLFYDPGLDTGCGYTAQTSPIYDEEGQIKKDIQKLGSLSPAALAALAEKLGLAIDGGKGIIGELSSPGMIDFPADDGPTPRPVPVQFTLSSFGEDVTAWEAQVP